MGSSTPPASALNFCRSSRRSCSLRFTKNNNDNNDDNDDNNAFQLLLPALCLALHTDWQPHYACKDCKRQPSCSLQFALPLHTGEGIAATCWRLWHCSCQTASVKHECCDQAKLLRKAGKVCSLKGESTEQTARGYDFS